MQPETLPYDINRVDSVPSIDSMTSIDGCIKSSNDVNHNPNLETHRPFLRRPASLRGLFRGSSQDFPLSKMMPERKKSKPTLHPFRDHKMDVPSPNATFDPFTASEKRE
eukprot:scaffold9606_cov99-Cylindrotheca_fusiformis.AAC.1